VLLLLKIKIGLRNKEAIRMGGAMNIDRLKQQKIINEYDLYILQMNRDYE